MCRSLRGSMRSNHKSDILKESCIIHFLGKWYYLTTPSLIKLFIECGKKLPNKDFDL